MLSLRVILVLVGIAIVIAVYLAAAAKRRRDTRISFDRRFSRLDIPDVILRHEEEDTEDDDVSERGPVGLPPALADDQPSAQPRTAPPVPDDDELPVVRNLRDDEPARSRSDQLDMFVAGEAPDEVAADAPAAARSTSPPHPSSARAAASASQRPAASASADGARDDGVVSLIVRAPEGREFGGPELVRAFNAVGMTHGEMSIFHHFGSGELTSDSALFSAADLFEPGTFDLARIEAVRTRGVVLFMQLPGPLDGAVVLELLLGSAQRFAELTGGTLFASPRQPLDPAAIAALRERVARLDDGGA